MESRLAVVTGGNRGIGLEICQQLARQGILVLLTSRNVGKGEEAAAVLQREGLKVRFHALDVADQRSARRLVKAVADQYGRLDILVNNAGVSLEKGTSSLTVDLALVRQTMETNFYGPLRLCQMLVPLMKRYEYGRIVNVSSQMGSLTNMGGGSLAYRTSKTALNALTRVMAADLRDSNILVNAVDPGWVRSDMGGPNAPRSLAEGADTAVWLATLPDGGPTGGFFRDRQSRPW